MPGVSERVLVQTLRDLEENNIVERIEVSEKPLRVEYRFTEYGQTLVPVFSALCNWGEKHLEKMNLQD